MKREGQRAVHLTQADLNLPSGVLERALNAASEFFGRVGLEGLPIPNVFWRYGVFAAAGVQMRRRW